MGTLPTRRVKGKEDIMARFVRRSTLVAGVIGFALWWSLSAGYANGATVQLSNVLSPGDAALCEEEFPSDATARLVYQQGDGHTQVRILVDKARPHALFTVWVILAKPSPLTGVEPTPMVPSDLVNQDLVDVTPPVDFPFGLKSPLFMPGDGDTTVYMDSTDPTGTGPGFGTRTVVPNGFYTDRFGRGMFETHLDFELVGGAYPFDRVAIPGRVSPGDLAPVSIGLNIPDVGVTPFAVVSHCKDEKGHGLVFRANPETGDQGWFLFVPEP
jgi:hypothetical protein